LFTRRLWSFCCRRSRTTRCSRSSYDDNDDDVNNDDNDEDDDKDVYLNRITIFGLQHKIWEPAKKEKVKKIHMRIMKYKDVTEQPNNEIIRATY
jgi:hypothetical protein